MNLKRLAGLALAALLLGGCAGLRPAAPPTAALSGTEVLSRLKSQQPQVQAFEAKGRLTLISPARNFGGATALLKGRPPATLRVDVRDLLGRSALSLATDGRQVEILSPQEAKLYRGPATPANLAAFIPPAVTVPQVLRLMLGEVPLRDGPPDVSQYEAAVGQYRLEWHGPGGTLQERLWVDGKDLNAVKEEFYGGADQPKFTVELGEYGRLPGNLPGRLALTTAAPKVELRLAYQEVTLNPALSAADLVLTVPPAVAVVPLP